MRKHLQSTITHSRRGGTGIVVVVGLILLLVAAGVGWYIWSHQPPKDDNKPDPTKSDAGLRASLDLVPADSVGFGTVALAKWWNSEQGKQFQQQIAEVEPSPYIEKVLGLPPENIEQLTLAVSKTSIPVTIVAATAPCKRDRVISMVAPNAAEQKEGNSAYHGNREVAVHFVSDRLYLFGPEEGIKQYLVRPSKTGALSEGALKEAAGLAQKHMAVVAVDPQFKELSEIVKQAGNSPFANAIKPVIDLRFAHLTLDLGDQLELAAQLSYADADTAKKNHPDIKKVVEFGRTSVAQIRSSLDPSMREAAAPFTNFLDSILRSATVEQEGAKVNVAVQSEKGSMGQLVAALGPAVQKVRESANRTISQNNLRQIGIAMHQHADIFGGQMPKAAIYSKTGQPLLSWRVAILPYIEQKPLYDQFKLDEPWDSEHNKKLIPILPKTYAPPGVTTSQPGMTFYRIFTGPMTPFPGQAPSRLPASFPDGLSNTILVVEAGEAVPWTKPDELAYDPQKPLPKLGGIFKGITNVLLGDATVRPLSPKVSEKTIRAAITPAGGEVLGDDW
jgi:hypothetical protein